MSITPKMISEQGFEQGFRGYDVKQVDDFLEFVAKEIGEMLESKLKMKEQLDAANEKLQNFEDLDIDPEEYAALRERADKAEEELKAIKSKALDNDVDPAELMQARAKIAELEQKLKDKEVSDDVISKAFISAQRSADALKEDARAEGERIYRESEAKARELLRDALVEKQRVLNEADEIKGSYEKFREEYKALIAHFSEEADKNFDSVVGMDVSDSAVDGLLEKAQEMDIEEDKEENTTANAVQEDAIEEENVQQTTPVNNVVNDSFFDDIEEIS